MFRFPPHVIEQRQEQIVERRILFDLDQPPRLHRSAATTREDDRQVAVQLRIAILVMNVENWWPSAV